MPRNDGIPPKLDRESARALADAGYMALSEYIRMFGADVKRENARRRSWVSRLFVLFRRGR